MAIKYLGERDFPRVLSLGREDAPLWIHVVENNFESLGTDL
jgi:hypothetical protein